MMFSATHIHYTLLHRNPFREMCYEFASISARKNITGGLGVIDEFYHGKL